MVCQHDANRSALDGNAAFCHCLEENPFLLGVVAAIGKPADELGGIQEKFRANGFPVFQFFGCNFQDSDNPFNHTMFRHENISCFHFQSPCCFVKT